MHWYMWGPNVEQLPIFLCVFHLVSRKLSTNPAVIVWHYDVLLITDWRAKCSGYNGWTILHPYFNFSFSFFNSGAGADLTTTRHQQGLYPARPLTVGNCFQLYIYRLLPQRWILPVSTILSGWSLSEQPFSCMSTHHTYPWNYYLCCCHHCAITSKLM